VGLSIDEWRDTLERAVLEQRDALVELAALVGAYVAEDTAPALHRAIKNASSANARLASFVAQCEAERQAVIEADLERAGEFERRAQAEAAAARARLEEAQRVAAATAHLRPQTYQPPQMGPPRARVIVPR
jgi:nucleotide-binding universal stress UspA family protein